MQVAWAAVDELGDERWDIAACGPFSAQISDLLLAWDLAGQKKPEEAFWEWLLTTWSLWKLLLAFWDCPATEPDTLLAVEDRALPNKGLDASSTAVDLVKCDFTNDL